MIRDGINYGVAGLLVAGLLWWLLTWPWAIAPLLLAVFFLWFFRDPERVIPRQEGAVVSAADGKVTEIATLLVDGRKCTRISVFLSVFDVHVNRSPIAGRIEEIEYRRGKFGNAMAAVSAEENEQNVVTVSGQGHTVIVKQIAGLLARRIVFQKRVGDRLERGERMGLIKFGSRTDVILPSDAILQVKIGDHVRGGSSVLATLPARLAAEPRSAVVEAARS